MSVGLRAGILFDVDGTLVDTNYLHTLAWSSAFADTDQWTPMNAIHRLLGMGGDHLVPRLIDHECPDAVAARTVRYQELIGDAKAFPGAHELVTSAHEIGLVTALATSSPADELDFLIDHLDIADVLDASTTGDEIESSKPDPEIFIRAMESAVLDPAQMMVVGDSVWDVQAARGAGLACVAVESGGVSRHELSEAGAVQVYRDVAEIRHQLQTSPLARLL